MHDATEAAFKNGYHAGEEAACAIIQEEIDKMLDGAIAVRNEQQDRYLESRGALEYIANLDGKIAGLTELSYYIDKLIADNK